ncbi:ribonuclease 3-like protein [Carex littledalei]|uniref:Ribonuclease 3-like protein n=1 Tax=Carex littledalei TaxID=544730 RepID=A0A833VTK5_9POAL|nr:ribonuclease 3-like protein [Carex littledalei]
MATLKPSLLLCMLAFLCISPFVPAQGAVESDFFYLNLLWPGSYCNSAFWKTCCMPITGEPALDFFVESMETYDSYSGNVVTNCNSTCNFYVNQLRNFITDMYSYWPDVKCPSNDGQTMWKSTFCKYGPCSNLTQAEYFQRALNLRKDLDLRILLATKGIVPSKTAMYYLEDIESALRAKLSFSFVVECNRNLQWFAESQLLRIKICISANGKNIISCPINKNTNCDSKVKFPLFTYGMLGHDAIDQSNPIKMPFERDQVI